MTRKSSQTTQRRGGGRQTGSTRSRGSAGDQSRQSSSRQRGSSQASSGRSRSGNRRGGDRQEEHQEWGFSHDQGGYGAGDERSFASGDYEQGRERQANSPVRGRGRGFASMDPERRREIAARGGRASHGRSGSEAQDERRFTREIDSYYGRTRGEPDFGRRDDFRESRGYGDERFRDRGDFREQGGYRSSGGGGERGDWHRGEPARAYDSGRFDDSGWRGNERYEEEDGDYYASGRSGGYSSGARPWGSSRPDDYQGSAYEDEDRRYSGPSRGTGRSHQDEDDRFFSGRGPREREDFSGSRRQSGSRTHTSSGRRRE